MGAVPSVAPGSSGWASYLLACVLPLATLGFTLTGPHSWYGMLCWVGVPYLLALIESKSSDTRERPAATTSRWRFDALLYLLAVLQVVNVWLLCRMASVAGFLSADTIAASMLFGVNTAFSGIVVAHELIHRRGKFHRQFGRLVCCTLLYEHFYTEHLRGHHARAGMSDDPETARFGETYFQYLRRSVPRQWSNAFEIERRRVGATRWWDARHLRNHVVQGALFQAALLGAIAAFWGPAALGLFVVQAATAICHLEAVNYFQHWGLSREGRPMRASDSWDADSRFSLFAMLALSRHADHHLNTARPYQALCAFDESPKLPRGYLGTLLLVLYRNRTLRDYLTAELRARNLGPFAPSCAAHPPDLT